MIDIWASKSQVPTVEPKRMEEDDMKGLLCVPTERLTIANM